MGEAISPAQLEREASLLDAPPLPEGFEFVSAAEAPMVAAAALQEAGAGGDQEDIPLIEEPADNTATLPGGLVHEGEVYRKATVRELNGEDEEFLARALAANDFGRYLQVLLERGVEKIGPLECTDKLLDQLVIGDRDTLVLAVRIATYGPTLDLDVTCMHCGLDSKIRVDFAEEVPTKPLAFPVEQPYQLVELRNGFANVRLANGADLRHVNGLERNRTQAELNTEIMLRCVESINGERVTRKQQILQLGMADRVAIVRWMEENQPGPEYDKIKHACTVCGKETPLGLTTGDMFRG